MIRKLLILIAPLLLSTCGIGIGGGVFWPGVADNSLVAINAHEIGKINVNELISKIHPCKGNEIALESSR